MYFLDIDVSPRLGGMVIFLCILGALGLAAIATTIVEVVRDGYRRVPTRFGR